MRLFIAHAFSDKLFAELVALTFVNTIDEVIIPQEDFTPIDNRHAFLSSKLVVVIIGDNFNKPERSIGTKRELVQAYKTKRLYQVYDVRSGDLVVMNSEQIEKEVAKAALHIEEYENAKR